MDQQLLHDLTRIVQQEVPRYCSADEDDESIGFSPEVEIGDYGAGEAARAIAERLSAAGYSIVRTPAP